MGHQIARYALQGVGFAPAFVPAAPTTGEGETPAYASIAAPGSACFGTGIGTSIKETGTGSIALSIVAPERAMELDCLEQELAVLWLLVILRVILMHLEPGEVAALEQDLDLDRDDPSWPSTVA